jgi:hypothetical protein
MGGALGRLNLMSPETMENISARLNVYPDVLRAIQGMGIALPETPSNGYKGEMPPDITALDDEKLGILLSNLSTWCGYVEGKLAEAKVLMDSASLELEKTQAQIRVNLKSDQNGKKLTNPERDDITNSNPKIVELASKALFTEAVYNMTKVVLNNAQRNWDTASRRITQRGQQIERMKREDNVAGIPTNPSRFRRPQ